jgi:hypothetical protein
MRPATPCGKVVWVAPQNLMGGSEIPGGARFEIFEPQQISTRFIQTPQKD